MSDAGPRDSRPFSFPSTLCNCHLNGWCDLNSKLEWYLNASHRQIGIVILPESPGRIHHWLLDGIRVCFCQMLPWWLDLGTPFLFSQFSDLSDHLVQSYNCDSRAVSINHQIRHQYPGCQSQSRRIYVHGLIWSNVLQYHCYCHCVLLAGSNCWYAVKEGIRKEIYYFTSSLESQSLLLWVCLNIDKSTVDLSCRDSHICTWDMVYLHSNRNLYLAAGVFCGQGYDDCGCGFFSSATLSDSSRQILFVLWSWWWRKHWNC